MPFQRGDPKPPGSGRIKGIPNKRTLAAAAMAVGASSAYAPAYDDLKQMTVQFKEWIAVEKKKKPLRVDRLITLYDRLARILEKTCQYERPKLQAVTLAGDHNNPLRVRADLSVLSDAELESLRKLALKAGGGHTAGVVEDADQRDRPRAVTKTRGS
jgi:hypothetical protein